MVRYAAALNGFDSLNLTKLDVLDELDEVKIAVGYKNPATGQAYPAGAFPATLEDLAEVEVVYESMPGWRSSSAGVTEFTKLPERAQQYIKRLQEICGVPISWIGTGPDRDHMIRNGF